MSVLQGVSNIIYGMGLMGAQWNQMGDAYTDAAYAAVVAGFGVAVQRRGTVRVVGIIAFLILCYKHSVIEALHHL